MNYRPILIYNLRTIRSYFISRLFWAFYLQKANRKRFRFCLCYGRGHAVITADEAWKSTAYVKSGQASLNVTLTSVLDNAKLVRWTVWDLARPNNPTIYVFEHGQDSRNKTSRQRIWYAFRATESQYIITAREHSTECLFSYNVNAWSYARTVLLIKCIKRNPGKFWNKMRYICPYFWRG